ncbi:MAG TPA: hypothetical protein VLW50_34480 [Streptosporangiaceae bacterium]|nr:hypothetical protein [Streptosporangiaceae bacterium]
MLTVGALELAVLATVSASRSHALAASGHSAAASLAGGYHLAFWIAAALVLGAIAVAVTMLGPEVQSTAASRGEHEASDADLTFAKAR